MVSYHERGRLRPEGVGVIAHVHYACESYPGRHRGVHMTTAKDPRSRKGALRRRLREEEMPSRHAVEESRTVFRREAIQLLVDEGDQVLKRIR